MIRSNDTYGSVRPKFLASAVRRISIVKRPLNFVLGILIVAASCLIPLTTFDSGVAGASATGWTCTVTLSGTAPSSTGYSVPTDYSGACSTSAELGWNEFSWGFDIFVTYGSYTYDLNLYDVGPGGSTPSILPPSFDFSYS